MKKRKPPVLAGTILMVLVVVAFLMNYGQKDNHKHEAPVVEEAGSAKALEAPRPTPTKDQLLTAAKVKSKDEDQVNSENVETAPDSRVTRPTQPTVFMNKPSMYKPRPNETDTSSMWYDSNSAEARK